MPVSRKAHQTQFPATPLVRTMLVTRFGVSVLKVVATMDTPMSHHGAARPDVKNSAVLDPARRASTMAGMNETMIDTTTMTQSSDVKRIGRRERGDGRRETEDGRRETGIGNRESGIEGMSSRAKRGIAIDPKESHYPQGVSSSVSTSNGCRSIRCGCVLMKRPGIM